MGGILLVVSGAVTESNLIFPELGLTSLAARLLLLVSVVCTFVWFWAFRAYQKRRNGVNIDLAFAQIPPD
jgi:hypothetical protein